jgi:hypothetical protein
MHPHQRCPPSRAVQSDPDSAWRGLSADQVGGLGGRCVQSDGLTWPDVLKVGPLDLRLLELRRVITGRNIDIHTYRVGTSPPPGR